MKVESKTIRLQGALHGFNEAGDQVVLQIDDLLIAIAEKNLRQIPEGVPTTLGSGGIGRVLTPNVAVDNAWTVDPDSKRILLARAGHIERIDPASQDKAQRVAIEGLPTGTFGAAAEPGGNRVLYVIVHDVNFDFSEFGVAIADLMLGRMVSEQSIRSNSDLHVSWNVGSRGWLISSQGKGIIWQWDGERPPVQGKGSSELKHPSLDLWASVTQNGAIQKVQLLDSTRKAITETSLKLGSQVKSLLWSTTSPERLWGLGIRAVVEMTLSN